MSARDLQTAGAADTNTSEFVQRPLWLVVAHFFGHTLAGCVLFMSLSLVVIVLDEFGRWLQARHVAKVVQQGLMLLEHASLVLIGLLMLAFVTVTGWNALRQILGTLKRTKAPGAGATGMMLIINGVGYVLAALGIFVIIGLAAAGLGEYVHWLQSRSVNDWIVECLGWMETLIFFVDAFLLVIFLLVTIIHGSTLMLGALRNAKANH